MEVEAASAETVVVVIVEVVASEATVVVEVSAAIEAEAFVVDVVELRKAQGSLGEYEDEVGCSS